MSDLILHVLAWPTFPHRAARLRVRLADPTRSYSIAMIVLAFFGLIGLGATVLLPAAEPAPAADVPAPAGAHRL